MLSLCNPGKGVFDWRGIRVTEEFPAEFVKISENRKTNPSIADDYVLVREVNYDLEVDPPIDWRPDTTNHLGRLRGRKVENLNPLEDNHRSNLIMVNGLEDGRLIRWNGRLLGLFSAHYHSGGRSVVVRNTMTLMDIRARCYRTFPTGKIEKNWMPFIQDGHLRVIYSVSPLVILDISERFTDTVQEGPGLDTFWSGSSQLVPYQDGWLGVVHRHGKKVKPTGSLGCRDYIHAFVYMDENFNLDLSPPFRFFGEGVEFCAGLTADQNELCLSFGVHDTDGYLAWVGLADSHRKSS